jgi:hypothetical protein
MRRITFACQPSFEKNARMLPDLLHGEEKKV